MLAVIAPDADDLPRPRDGHLPAPLLGSAYMARQRALPQGDAPVDPGRIRFIFPPVTRGPAGWLPPFSCLSSGGLRRPTTRAAHVNSPTGSRAPAWVLPTPLPGHLGDSIQGRLPIL